MPKRKRDGDSEWESASDTSEPQQHSSRRRRLVDNERINIINALHAFIQEERRTNFSFLSQHSHYHKHQNELLVVSQADADDVKVVCDSARHDTTAYNNWFTFTEPLRSDGFARTVVIDVPSGSSVAVEDLTITEFGKIKKTRRKAAAWIRDTYCTAEDDMWAMRLPEPQYEEQRLWWEGTGQAFRLLDLPLEMREAIYLHVIGPVVVPDIVTQGGAEKLVLGYGLSYDNPDRVGRNRDPNIQRPNMEIMRVSRQVKVEATHVANRDTVKRFTTIRTRGDGIGPATPPKEIWRKLGQLPTPDNFLKRLQLEMAATEFLAFGGICPQLGQPLARGVVPINVTSMARLRNLDTIDFRFIGPEHELANCPWKPLHPCQKKWIDIFFITAWNDLVTLRNTKGIKYTMSGCIKDSTRNYWTGLLNDKRNDHTAGIRILEQDLQIAITNTTSLACECSNPCVGGPRLFRVQPHEMRLIDGIQAELDKAYWDFED
ncbi:hypothetical protein J4E93_010045 [Alternaria ventricosa]|uniref:uncharacterized protein n=1 Tax=Alternaria ventricosa TaxID=1187951 RepID=UPI0020C435E9|nr:uncharacterized protein J4E93_010045 [Alternaria ventricosa]KAI4638491.1 hypothetical protein J4E93_010045 [Alternaria ventricosa]